MLVAIQASEVGAAARSPSAAEDLVLALANELQDTLLVLEQPQAEDLARNIFDSCVEWLRAQSAENHSLQVRPPRLRRNGQSRPYAAAAVPSRC